MKLTEAARVVLSMRSEKDKIGVPVNRLLVPPHLGEGLDDCLANKWLTWIDSCNHPAANGLPIDVYLLTPAGRLLIEGGK